jgi:hypothetical protein
MDKHDRPYKCQVAGCEKLQGFTYSGGLLRHEREVHKLHGGTKKSLFCPHPDCKRSSGTGFTRKENRDEHIRRVHRRASGSSEAPKVDEAESPEGLPIGETQPEPEALGTRKRKRSDTVPAYLEDRDDPADLDAEVKRLRAENKAFRRESEAKDARLAELEATVRNIQQLQQQQVHIPKPR